MKSISSLIRAMQSQISGISSLSAIDNLEDALQRSGVLLDSQAMTLAGLTAVKDTGTPFTTAFPLTDTYYQMSETSVTVGSITGGLTDNNDLSFTNNSGVDKEIFGFLTVTGGLNTKTFNISMGTDNSGSMAVYRDGSGAFIRSTVDDIPNLIIFRLPLNAGKTVAPLIKNVTDTTSFQWFSAKLYVWSYD